jgi:uncharacterized DUF497 family protein
LIFDWDDANRAHIARHRVSTTEAEEVLQNDPEDLEEQAVSGENRYKQVGETNTGRILIVIATLRFNTIRVVTAWEADATTKRDYLRKRSS